MVPKLRKIGIGDLYVVTREFDAKVDDNTRNFYTCEVNDVLMLTDLKGSGSATAERFTFYFFIDEKIIYIEGTWDDFHKYLEIGEKKTSGG